MRVARTFQFAAVRLPPLYLILSCGGAQAPLEAPTAAPRPPLASVAAAPLDLAAVPDPAALVISGSIAKPGASLSTIRGWSKVPLPLPPEMTATVMGGAVGALIDLDQPIDFAVSVAGRGLRVRARIAVSAALKDAGQAKAILSERSKLVAADNGVLLIRKSASLSHDDDTDQATDEGLRACELAPSYGNAATRIVCGSTPEAVTDLGPWLTRTATRTTRNADLHVDLRMGPLRSIITGQKRLIGNLLNGAVGGRAELGGAKEIASSVALDVIDFAVDLDSASVDVELSDPATMATMTMKFASTTSAFARIATAHPDRSSPAPATFWQLPGDADVAFFHRGIGAAELARGRDLVLRAVADGLAERGLKDADRKAIVDALGKMASAAPMAYASGADWHLIGLDEPSASFAAAAKEFVAAWGTPSVGAAYRAKPKGPPPPLLRVAPLPKGVTLPGAQHYVLERRGANASPPAVTHIFVVPDGSRTWIGLGTSDVLVASKVALAIAPASGGGLAARAELAPFKTAIVGAGGFATVAALPQAVDPLAFLVGGGTAGLGEAVLSPAQLPHKGTVPVMFSFTASGGDASPALVTSVQVPRAAMEDIVAAILPHAF